MNVVPTTLAEAPVPWLLALVAAAVVVAAGLLFVRRNRSDVSAATVHDDAAGEPTRSEAQQVAFSAPASLLDTGPRRGDTPHTSSGGRFRSSAHAGRAIDTGPAADGSTRSTMGASSETDDTVERTSETGPTADGSTRSATEVGSTTAASPDPALDTNPLVDDDPERSAAGRAGPDVETETGSATARNSAFDSPAGAVDRTDRAVAGPGPADTDAGSGEPPADHRGDPDAGTEPTGDAGAFDISETYTTVRRRLERELDIDGRWTTRQFYHACQMRGLDDDRLTALERLTRAYERVQDGDDPAADPEELRTAAAVFGLDDT